MGFTLADAAGLTPHTARYLANANEALGKGLRVLVVGSKGSNFEDRLRKDPRFEFWDSTDPATATRTVPTQVGAMLFLKYLPHHLHQRLCSEAEKRGFRPLTPLQSTGQVRKLLAILANGGPTPAEEQPVKQRQQAVVVPGLAEDASVEAVLGPEEERPEDPAATARARRSGHSAGLYKAVEGLMDLPREVYFGEIRREAERLLPLVHDAYPKTTVDDLQAAVSNLRKKRGDPPSHLTRRPEPPSAITAPAEVAEVLRRSQEETAPDYRRLTSTEIMVESAKLAEAIEAEKPPDPGLADGMAMLVEACTLFLKAAPLVIERLDIMSTEVERLKAERNDYKERLDLMTEALTRPLKK